MDYHSVLGFRCPGLLFLCHGCVKRVCPKHVVKFGNRKASQKAPAYSRLQSIQQSMNCVNSQAVIHTCLPAPAFGGWSTEDDRPQNLVPRAYDVL